jgi:hypothetical protein
MVDTTGRKKMIPNTPTPSRYRCSRGYHNDMTRYNKIKSIKVCWVKEVPYFFIGNNPLQMTHKFLNNTLVYEGMTLAAVDIKIEKRDIVFYVIYEEDSQSVDFLDYYVY